jgi:hypothetical protein
MKIINNLCRILMIIVSPCALKMVDVQVQRTYPRDKSNIYVKYQYESMNKINGANEANVCFDIDNRLTTCNVI